MCALLAFLGRVEMVASFVNARLKYDVSAYIYAKQLQLPLTTFYTCQFLNTDPEVVTFETSLLFAITIKGSSCPGREEDEPVE